MHWSEHCHSFGIRLNKGSIRGTIRGTARGTVTGRYLGRGQGGLAHDGLGALPRHGLELRAELHQLLAARDGAGQLHHLLELRVPVAPAQGDGHASVPAAAAAAARRRCGRAAARRAVCWRPVWQARPLGGRRQERELVHILEVVLQECSANVQSGVIDSHCTNAQWTTPLQVPYPGPLLVGVRPPGGRGKEITRVEEVVGRGVIHIQARYARVLHKYARLGSRGRAVQCRCFGPQTVPISGNSHCAGPLPSPSQREAPPALWRSRAPRSCVLEYTDGPEENEQKQPALI